MNMNMTEEPNNDAKKTNSINEKGNMSLESIKKDKKKIAKEVRIGFSLEEYDAILHKYKQSDFSALAGFLRSLILKNLNQS